TIVSNDKVSLCFIFDNIAFQYFLFLFTGQQAMPYGILHKRLQQHGLDQDTSHLSSLTAYVIDVEGEILIKTVFLYLYVFLDQIQLLAQGDAFLFTGFKYRTDKSAKDCEIIDCLFKFLRLYQIFNGVQAIEQKMGIHLHS